MGDIPGRLLIHTAVIEPLAGEGPLGAVYGPPVTVRCRREDKRRLVRTAGDTRTENEVVSFAVLYMRLEEICPVGSRVTIGDRVAVVTAALRREGGIGPVDHLEVTLT